MTTTPVLPSTARRLDRVLAQEQISARAPSLVAGVVRDGELCWTGVRGDSVGPGLKSPSPHHTQYRIGSLTKTLTAVLVMQLRDRGQLSLDDRLGDHLPGVPYGERTLRELLSHVGGLPAEPAGPWWERSPGVGFDELMHRISTAGGVLPRGQQFHYSNLAYALVGRVVEVHHGCTWMEALAEHALGPLEMRRTTYEPRPGAAQGYSVSVWTGAVTEEPHQDTVAMAPAGQLWSTIGDLARLAAFLTDPDAAVLSPESLAEMCLPRSGTPDGGKTVTYGLGLRLMAGEGGAGLVGHTGSMPGFLAGLFVDKERGTGAVCVANGTAGLRCDGLPADLLAVLETEEPALPPAWTPTREVDPQVTDLLGVWHWGETALWSRLDGDSVSMAPPGDERGWKLRRTGPDTFVGLSGYLTGETLHVVRRPDGSVSHLECATFILTREPYDPDAPIPGGSPRG